MNSVGPLNTGTLEVEEVIEEREREKLTTEEVINMLMKGCTAKFLFFYYLGSLSLTTVNIMIYIPIFTGHIPYDEWECLSPHCFALLANSTTSSAFYTRTKMCDNQLKAGVDFVWTVARTSFSVEWELSCSQEHKLAAVNSFFFVGAFLGLVSASALLDSIGRKKTTVLGSAVAIAATLTGAFVNSLALMLLVRVVQGCGTFVLSTGLTVWTMEFCPSSLRCFKSLFCAGALTGAGTLTLVLMALLVKEWWILFVVVAVFSLVTSIPLLFYPESPRFHLVNGNEDKAKETLNTLSRIFNRPISFRDEIELVYSDHGHHSYLSQLRDFLLYPKMLRTTLLLMVAWFVVATLFFALNFGWNELGANIFTSMVFSVVGIWLGNVFTYGTTALIGRKKALMLCFGLSALAFLAAIPNVNFSGDWGLEGIACLFANAFIGGAFSTIYLLTSELAPTSHRGMILSMCSSSARIGSFVGPYTSLLYGVLDKKVVLVMFAVVAGCVCGELAFVGDSTGKQIPDTPAEMKQKHKATVG